MKPSPPKNMWEQMDALRAECGMVAPPEPNICSVSYREKYGVTEHQARHELQQLVKAGKLKLWGTYKGIIYYVTP